MFRIAVVFAIVAGSARAEAEKISIDQLLQAAVVKSPTLTFVRQTRRLGQLAVEAAGVGGEWQVQTTAAAERAHDATATSTQVTGTLGLSKQVPTGGAISLAVESRNQTSAVTLSLRQSLLRGRGDGAHVDQRKARIAADAITLQAREDSAAFVRTLVEAYWELAFAHANLGVRKQSLKLARSQLELTKKMFDRGAVPDNAVKSALYGVALREEAVLRASDAMQSASLQLRELAGLEIAIDDDDLVPVDALFATRAVDMQAAVSAALAHNPRIAAAQLGVAIACVEHDRRKNRALPALDVALSASAVGAGPDRVGAFETLGTGYVVGGSVAMTWEIGGAAGAAADAARVEKLQARTSVRATEREIVADVIDVVRRIAAAKQRAAVAERAIELAQANLDTELALFRADKSSNVLVFERQTELDEARLLASRAAADSLIASATLDYLTGTLLDHFGIEVIPNPTQGARHGHP